MAKQDIKQTIKRVKPKGSLISFPTLVDIDPETAEREKFDLEITEDETEVIDWKDGFKPRMKKVKLSFILNKLEEGFSIGLSNEEACFYAGITPDTLYRWKKLAPELAERWDALKKNPVIMAKATVARTLSQNYGNAMDFLKRKLPMEFGDKSMNLNANLNEQKLILTFSDEELRDIYAKDDKRNTEGTDGTSKKGGN